MFANFRFHLIKAAACAALTVASASQDGQHASTLRSGSAFASVSASLTQAEQQSIVAMHNLARNSVSPPAADMSPISWDDGIAAMAASYAAKCVTVHSHTPGFGENLAWGWPEMTPESAVGLWEAEKSIFNFQGSDMGCGHYTQMVWAKSTKVGCAKQSCGNLSGKGKGDVYVCNYSAPGNYLNAQGKIGSPYQAGQPSSQSAPAPAPAPAPAAQESTPQAAPLQEQKAQAPAAQPTPQAAPQPQSKAADTYHWEGGNSQFGQCSASCGQGVQSRNVYCANQDGQGADWNKCDFGSKPKTQQSCEAGPCPAPKPTPAPAPAAPLAKEEPKPQPQQQQQAAPAPAPTPSPSPVVSPSPPAVTYDWSIGLYSVCSAACEGVQTRSVSCKSSAGDVSAEGACSSVKPESRIPCNGVCPPSPPASAPAPVAAPAPDAKAKSVDMTPVASAPAPVAPLAAVQAVAEPIKDMSLSVPVQACANDTVISQVESLFNSTQSLNASGLLRSSFDTSAPGSLNCSAVFYYLNATSLANCSRLLNSSAINSTGGAPEAEYTLGDCIDSLYNTSLEIHTSQDETASQTHFGTLNFTRLEFESDYEDQSRSARALVVRPRASGESETVILKAALPSSTNAESDAQAKAELLERTLSAKASAAQSSAMHVTGTAALSGWTVCLSASFIGAMTLLF